MKTVLIRLVAALALAFGAWASWREARIIDRAADARLALALLRDDAAAPEPGWTISDALLTTERPLAVGSQRDKATADYWRGRFADAMDIGRQELDPDLLLVAANASFRASQREGTVGQPAVQRLDGVLQAYAAVLKAAPRQAEAAYNYEFVARLRDAIARASASGARAKPDAPAAAPVRTPASDLPAGRTLHGFPGAPPPDVKAEDFQIIAPMEFGDREAQPDPTPGGKLPRKG